MHWNTMGSDGHAMKFIWKNRKKVAFMQCLNGSV